MSGNKKAAPKPAENNDDLLGGDATQETPKQETPKPAAKKTTAKKPSAAEVKKIKAAQGSDENDYLPEENERHLVHVKMEKKNFSPSTGEKLTKDYVQKYTANEWNSFEKNGRGLGFTCTILWNPENYK